MSDKLKIMQTRITSSNEDGDIELFCASIGYPHLKAIKSSGPIAIGSARDCQPVVEIIVAPLRIS